tara:strand:- start:423 stop:698 length:276 start_codon:yes stop_codon:yes gene_type:complete
MKSFTDTWNYDLSSMPKMDEKIIIDFGNGMGSDRRYPYQVEDISAEVRGDFVVCYVEGRQLKKDGSFKDNCFQLLFTNKPKAHIGWDKEVA